MSHGTLGASSGDSGDSSVSEVLSSVTPEAVSASLSDFLGEGDAVDPRGPLEVDPGESFRVDPGESFRVDPGEASGVPGAVGAPVADFLTGVVGADLGPPVGDCGEEVASEDILALFWRD